MAVKIRLSRIGSKKRPFYRVVAVHERSKRTGAYLELLGTYNPLTEPHEITLNKERIDYWMKSGAIPSTGYLRIIGQAPKRLPRKPKKNRGGESPKEIAITPEKSVDKVEEEPSTVTGEPQIEESTTTNSISETETKQEVKQEPKEESVS